MTENERQAVLRDIRYGYMDVWDSLIMDELFKQIEEEHKEIQQYKAIGSAEGYERAINLSIENYKLYREYKAKVQEFEAIGTIEELQELKEKSVAKKPNQVSRAMDKDKFVGLIGRCPNCGSIVAEDNFVCEDCFQVLDWE